MGWLNYSDDEVFVYHPAFAEIGHSALQELGLADEYEWIHHPRQAGSTGIVPDFVLADKGTGYWKLVLELKRTERDVYSSRYQYQAKSYVEDNKSRFRPNSPLYFAVSNLETTLLFAALGGARPDSCRVKDGMFVSGSFINDTKESHQSRYKEDLKSLITIVISNASPSFDIVWPSIVETLIQYSLSVPYDKVLEVEEPKSDNWSLVRSFLVGNDEEYERKILLLRCLMAEYLRGRLTYYGHRHANRIPPLRPDRSGIINAYAALGSVDFQLFFNSESIDQVVALPVSILESVVEYVKKIIPPINNVARLSAERADAQVLLESFADMISPIGVSDGRGKVSTDPELAALLAVLAIKSATDVVVDPCCGDGQLLIAAYERKSLLGGAVSTVHKEIFGVEADPILVRIGALRMALVNPKNISPDFSEIVSQGDFFRSSELLHRANTILINPPFRRYEEQSVSRFPIELREHYRNSVADVKRADPKTLGGQPNLFNYFVEYLTESIEEGTVVGFILDNKWYHNKYGASLRALILEKFEIRALIEYPHSIFFKNFEIATSILIVERRSSPNLSNVVKFVRSGVDPRSVDFQQLRKAMYENGPWPFSWSCINVLQGSLGERESWKPNFSSKLRNDYRSNEWPTLTGLFTFSRRGSLQKEGGGTHVYEFPFQLSKFGNKRYRREAGIGWQTVKGDPLTDSENTALRSAASRIPAVFRGYALQNADDIGGYELSLADVTKKECIEPPRLRSESVQTLYFNGERVPWTSTHDEALLEMKENLFVNEFIEAVETIIGLNEEVLPKENIWVGLREAYAGELILPRKTRAGHRVHVNGFAFDRSNRQVRISSNFLSFSNCVSDLHSGLDRRTSTELIAAFMLSSFGQLQYEILGINREGVLSMEREQFDQLKIFDPRWVRVENRLKILSAYRNLPYPISTNRLSFLQSQRNELDNLFADEIINWQNIRNVVIPFDKQDLLDEVHDKLDEWLLAREP